MRLTRGSLEIINAFQFGVSLAPKSVLITRNIDGLQEIHRHSPGLAIVTPTASQDCLLKRIEPATSSSERFKALAKLRKGDYLLEYH